MFLDFQVISRVALWDGRREAVRHLTRQDDRFDYGETRYVTVGRLDDRWVAFVWTPRGTARRIISMRHCHEREAKKIRPYLLEH